MLSFLSNYFKQKEVRPKTCSDLVVGRLYKYDEYVDFDGTGFDVMSFWRIGRNQRMVYVGQSFKTDEYGVKYARFFGITDNDNMIDIRYGVSIPAELAIELKDESGNPYNINPSIISKALEAKASKKYTPPIWTNLCNL